LGLALAYSALPSNILNPQLPFEKVDNLSGERSVWSNAENATQVLREPWNGLTIIISCTFGLSFAPAASDARVSSYDLPPQRSARNFGAWKQASERSC
jgi:hypothetical protein